MCVFFGCLIVCCVCVFWLFDCLLCVCVFGLVGCLIACWLCVCFWVGLFVVARSF